jgi:phospholipase C
LQYRAAGLLFFLLVAGGGIVACTGTSTQTSGPLPAASIGGDAKGSTPIEHVIVIVQENRSFDNFFATFYGANGTTVGYAEPMPSPIASSCAAKKQPVITEPTTVPLTEVDINGLGFPNKFGWDNDLAHNYKDGYLLECDSSGSQPSASKPCAMDGFDTTKFGPDGEGPQATCTYTYQYVNPSDIAPYWAMAQQYVLADNAFQTQGSESFTAHQALIAGGTAINATQSLIDDPTGFPWGCDAQPSGTSQQGSVTSVLTIYGQYLGDQGPFPCLTYPNGTIRDLLDAKKVSWKFYAEKVYNWSNPKAGGPGIWSAFDAIQNVRYSKEWGTKVTSSDLKIFSDIKTGHLPAVSWVTPDAANSDHPDEKNKNGAPVDTGPSWVASVVNAIGESKYWKTSAVIVLWDDWGGYYDHVQPPFYDNQGGLGFRFPLIIISPYVQAHVEHTQYETTSVLRFIENNWSLGTLGQEDQRATSISNAFDFNQTPRPFQAIPSKYKQSFFLHQKPSGLPPDSE